MTAAAASALCGCQETVLNSLQNLIEYLTIIIKRMKQPPELQLMEALMEMDHTDEVRASTMLWSLSCLVLHGLSVDACACVCLSVLCSWLHGCVRCSAA